MRHALDGPCHSLAASATTGKPTPITSAVCASSRDSESNDGRALMAVREMNPGMVSGRLRQTRLRRIIDRIGTLTDSLQMHTYPSL